MLGGLGLLPTVRGKAAAPASLPTRLGINLVGGAGGEAVLPGIEGTHYRFPDAMAFAYAAAQGARLVRIDLLWERIQPVLGGALHEPYLDRLRALAGQAAAARLGVLWNLHNYARRRIDGTTHIIGATSGPVTRAHLADCWRRLAAALKPTILPATYAYGIMNEPHDMPAPGHWAESAQAAVDAICAEDATTTIYVPGDGWSSARNWRDFNENLAIRHPDPSCIVYEAHQYNDPASRFAGVYQPPGFDSQQAVPGGYAAALRPFLDWLEQRQLRGAIGECGVPDADPRWTESLAGFLRAGISARLDAMFLWAYAPFFGEDYVMQLAPSRAGQRRAIRLLSQLSSG